MKENNYILILGNNKEQNRRGRCDAACNYLTKRLIVDVDKSSNIIYSHKIVCMGRNYVKNNRVSHLMKNYLIAGGLIDDLVIVEDKSVDAISSLLNFKNMLIENGIICPKTFSGFVNEIVICTTYYDSFLLACKIFAKYNIHLKCIAPRGYVLKKKYTIIENTYDDTIRLENTYDDTIRPESIYDNVQSGIYYN